MSEEFMREVEINGVKVEVDMRYARRIDTFKVGDNVKILKKGDKNSSYNNEDKVFPGMIVDFANFKELPTLVIAYFDDSSWSSTPDIRFIYWNAELNGYDIVYCDENELKVSGESIAQKFETAILKKRTELDEIIAKRDYFVEHFVPKKGEE